MHEMALAESALVIVAEAARTAGLTQVSTVVLEIGALAAVEPEAMAFCFAAVAADTVAAGATLEIVNTPGAGRCAACGGTAALAAIYDPCPACGAYRMEVTAGMAMRVVEILGAAA